MTVITNPQPLPPNPQGPVTLEMVRSSPEICCYLQASDEQSILKGYTEHGLRHANLVSTVTHGILLQLQVPPRRAELGAIAGYLHDMGNLVGRGCHASSAALLALELLRRMGMPPEEMVVVAAAIANHDEVEGGPVSDISAALILADKADVHRSRVRNPNPAAFDNHDRVNYAARRSFVRVDAEKREISLNLTIDGEPPPGAQPESAPPKAQNGIRTNGNYVLDYFEIFLPRMLMARKAAEFLGCQFELHINNTRVA